MSYLGPCCSDSCISLHVIKTYSSSVLHLKGPQSALRLLSMLYRLYALQALWIQAVRLQACLVHHACRVDWKLLHSSYNLK